jgi:pSer/pThr/pTyr-binding forkhead associated (FHA) protein
VGEGEEFSPFLVDRSTEADFFLNDMAVSRRHCRILFQTGNILLEDLGSQTGTFCNGRRVSRPVDLYDGDEIRAGDVVLRVRIEGGTPGTEWQHPLLRGKGEKNRPDIQVLGRAPDLVIPLGREVLTLGRAPACSVRLEHPTISRRHAEVRLRTGRSWCETSPLRTAPSSTARH